MEQMILYVIMACMGLALMLSSGEQAKTSHPKKETAVAYAKESSGMPELTETSEQDVAEIVSFEYDFGECFVA